MITPKQKKVLDYIESFLEKKGYAPSQQEIAKHFQFKSLGTVQNYLVRLERHGLLKRTWNARRATEPVSPASPAAPARLSPPSRVPSAAGLAVPLPLLGRVAAGKPIEAIDQDATIDVPQSMLRAGADHYVLRVSGNSMIEDGILDGDFVVIESKKEARNGQTVVALVGNEATIKRFYRRRNNVELHPANPAYEPIVLSASMVDTPEKFRIEGLLVGVIRRLDG